MKVVEVLTEGYIAWVLNDHSREQLSKIFPPKYPEFIGHHVTYTLGTKTNLPQVNSVKVVGYSEEDGLEALVVEIDGTTKRPDGNDYHITWSLDRTKGKKPKDSNTMIQRQGWKPVNPIEIAANIEVVK